MYRVKRLKHLNTLLIFEICLRIKILKLIFYVEHFPINEFLPVNLLVLYSFFLIDNGNCMETFLWLWTCARIHFYNSGEKGHSWNIILLFVSQQRMKYRKYWNRRPLGDRILEIIILAICSEMTFLFFDSRYLLFKVYPYMSLVYILLISAIQDLY